MRCIVCVLSGGRGGGGEVHVRLAAVVKLQPSVVSDNGRVSAGGGGENWAPTPTHRDKTSPDKRPDKAPLKKVNAINVNYYSSVKSMKVHFKFAIK